MRCGESCADSIARLGGLPGREDLLHAGPKTPHEAVELVEALEGVFEQTRIGVDAMGVGAQVAREVLEVTHLAVKPRGELVEFVVNALLVHEVGDRPGDQVEGSAIVMPGRRKRLARSARAGRHAAAAANRPRVPRALQAGD